MHDHCSKVIQVALLLALMLVGVVGAAPIESSDMSWYRGETDAVEQNIIARFNELNPDIRVSKIGGDPRQKLLTMIAGGEPPDVSVIDGP